MLFQEKLTSRDFKRLKGKRLTYLKQLFFTTLVYLIFRLGNQVFILKKIFTA